MLENNIFAGPKRNTNAEEQIKSTGPTQNHTRTCNIVTQHGIQLHISEWLTVTL